MDDDLDDPAVKASYDEALKMLRGELIAGEESGISERSHAEIIAEVKGELKVDLLEK